MSAQPKITLYDATSLLEERSISPFVRRVRIVLELRKIPFKTEWIEFPDIERVSKSVGAAPTKTKSDGSPHYTIPFITIDPPAGSNKPPVAISDSINIVTYLEKTFPNPAQPLFPEGTAVLEAAFQQYISDKLLSPAFPVMVKSVAEGNFFTPETASWYEKTREKLLGKPLDEVVPKDEAAVAEALVGVEKAFDGLAALFDKGGEGNYRVMGLGDRICYVEIELISSLYFMKRAAPKVWKKVEGRNDGRWKKLLDAYSDVLPVH